MKWMGRRSSSNVNRESGSQYGGFSGRRSRLPLSGGSIILIIIISVIFKINPLYLLGLSGGESDVRQANVAHERQYEKSENREMEDFLSVVLADTEDVWHEIFKKEGMTYREPKMTLYRRGVKSACGIASSEAGPFYCPADEIIYIDASFAEQLRFYYGANGDYTMAYVLAHEVGHHVQKQLGILDEVMKLRNKLPEKEYNKYQIAMELQADYFAGVFSHYIDKKGYLDRDDIEEAMRAAEVVGDDHIHQKTIGRVMPDKFTHGTSKDRMKWFMRGYEYGDLEHGNTFDYVNKAY